MPNPGKYSFAWAGENLGDDTFKLLKTAYDSKDLKEMFATLDGPQFDRYVGMGFNTLYADTSGNIGYRLVSTMPVRKDKTPFIGHRILDGTKSKFDWAWGDLIPLRDLPKSLNPKKGYLVTANGRQTSDHAKHDYGAGMSSTPRHVRIDEIISSGIASGKKFTLEDMGAIQQDVVDIVARRMNPKIIDITQEVLHHLNDAQKKDLEEMLEILRPWEGSFDKESVGASVYQRWYIQFTRNLFNKQGEPDEYQRMAYFDNPHDFDAFQRILTSVHEEKDASRFQIICEGAYENYSGRNFCAFSAAMALLETKEFLTSNVSMFEHKWEWGMMHVNDYVNLPWSRTPLKFIFHK